MGSNLYKIIKGFHEKTWGSQIVFVYLHRK